MPQFQGAAVAGTSPARRPGSAACWSRRSCWSTCSSAACAASRSCRPSSTGSSSRAARAGDVRAAVWYGDGALPPSRA
jgi:hypothetical protein